MVYSTILKHGGALDVSGDEDACRLQDLRRDDEHTHRDEAAEGHAYGCHDAIDRDGSANEEFIFSYFERGHLGNRRHINECLNGCVSSLFEIEQQVGPPCYRYERTRRVRERVHSFR